MPTKSERLIGRLPSTFRPAPGVSALAAIAGALGEELQQAENTLAAVLAAHWVDHADIGSDVLVDLVALGAAYGLGPRDDESVEEFRRHLLRYVRTFLEGPATVRGLIRVSAEALGLDVADDGGLLPWWQNGPRLVTTEPHGADAARLVFGWAQARSVGHSATRAVLTGAVQLTDPVVVGDATRLSVALDDAPAVTVDITVAAADPAAPTLAEIVTAINEAVAAADDQPVALLAGRRLRIQSPTPGAAGRLELPDVDSDAAELLLGLAPRRSTGSAATPGRIVGAVELDVVDLSQHRYLRVVVDGTQVVELDCAGPDPAATTAAQVRDTLNAALGAPVAELAGGRLVLRSPSTGTGSRVEVARAAAQDAATALFGVPVAVGFGQDALAARLQGRADLGEGIDLPAGAVLELSLDGGATVTVACTGATPDVVTASDVVAAVQEVLPGAAVTDGRTVTLISTTTGPQSSIEVGAPEGDAAPAVLGLPPRQVTGSAAGTATVLGAADLSGGVDLLPAHLVSVALDGAAPVEVDLRAGADDPRTVTRAEIIAALDGALGAPVASAEGAGIRLTSPRPGSAGSVAVEPLVRRRERAFVTRAPVLTEIAPALLGFLTGSAVGSPAVPARVAGEPDLRPGVDLRRARFLRLAVDGGPFVDVDCAGPRPAVTVLADVLARINTEFPIATAGAGGRLVLTSPTAGAAGSIAFAPPQQPDAAALLLGTGPVTVTGRGGSTVDFRGTVDLSSGVDLPASAMIRLTVDGQTRDIDCAGGVAGSAGAVEIVAAINAAFPTPVASRDGGYVRITSALAGADSEVGFAVPDGADATRVLVGLDPPRSYRGAGAVRAVLDGAVDLPATLDLRLTRYLRLSIDRAPAREVDCAAGVADPRHATPAEVVQAINSALGAPVASVPAGRLRIASTKDGAAGSVAVQPYLNPDDDARTALFGSLPNLVRGQDATAATLRGELIPAPAVDASRRGVLRVAVDGGLPIDVDVTGTDPAATTLPEVVARLDETLPGVASVTPDGRLQLRSRSPGPDSRIEVLPPRCIEVLEYLPVDRVTGALPARPGTRIETGNDSVRDEAAVLSVTAPQGAVAPGVVALGGGSCWRVLEVLLPGETLELSPDPRRGVRARVRTVSGAARPVPPAAILTGPVASRLSLPAAMAGVLSDGDGGPPRLLLHDPTAPAQLLLRQRAAGSVSARAVEADLTGAAGPGAEDGPVAVLGRVGTGPGGVRLLGAGGDVVAELLAADGVDLTAHDGRVVRVRGLLRAAPVPVLVVHGIANVFDVEVTGPDGTSEQFRAVSVGADADEPRSLLAQLELAGAPSTLVRARPVPKVPVQLPSGGAHWLYVEGVAARFDTAAFDTARFAGAPITEVGIFDVSCFAGPGQPVGPVFAGTDSALPAAELTLRWSSHAAATVAVNLPADLPPRFGARFDQARFAAGTDAAERYPGVVVEPEDDPAYLPALLLDGSSLVTATEAVEVPAGAPAAAAPFRIPRRLAGGAPGIPAMLYLTERTLPGAVQVSARQPGEWGNDIELVVRPAGPGRYDVTVAYAAAVFENARDVALGEAAAPSGGGLSVPGRVGLRQARAAGIPVVVTRDRTEQPSVPTP